MSARLCIAVHDVAPATWPQCERLLDLLDGLGRPPLTLLAVPNYHGRGALRSAKKLVRVLQSRSHAGDEIALHGYLHHDAAPPPRTGTAWLRRRVLTAGEGEFATLSRDAAAYRIRQGLDEINLLFGPVRGFVAPAWLSSASTWAALRESPLQYAATHGALVELASMRHVAAPAITVSARSRWRRVASGVWLRAMLQATASRPLIRIALHPTDADHPEVLRDWDRALRRLLALREPVTKARALGLA